MMKVFGMTKVVLIFYGNNQTFFQQINSFVGLLNFNPTVVYLHTAVNS